jgi:plasmid stabilization system protein ParE
VRLVFQRLAGQDLEDAGLFYEAREIGLGERFLDDVDRLLLQIQENPARFPAVGRGVRRGLVKSFPYAIYFLIDDGSIVVVGILHQHRIPSTWLERR